MIAGFDQLHPPRPRREFFGQCQRQLPGHVLVALSMDQPDRYVHRNFRPQQQMGIALIQQLLADPVGLAIVVTVGQVGAAARRQPPQLRRCQRGAQAGGEVGAAASPSSACIRCGRASATSNMIQPPSRTPPPAAVRWSPHPARPGYRRASGRYSPAPASPGFAMAAVVEACELPTLRHAPLLQRQRLDALHIELNPAQNRMPGVLPGCAGRLWRRRRPVPGTRCQSWPGTAQVAATAPPSSTMVCPVTQADALSTNGYRARRILGGADTSARVLTGHLLHLVLKMRRHLAWKVPRAIPFTLTCWRASSAPR